MRCICGCSLVAGALIALLAGTSPALAAEDPIDDQLMATLSEGAAR